MNEEIQEPNKSLQPPEQKWLQESLEDPATIQTFAKPPKEGLMSPRTFFKDMQIFLNNCRFDKRLTPVTQLVYRTLVDLANRHYWLHPFTVSNEELKEITHIRSDDDITRAKQRLKALGYIDFIGKPTKYILYSPAERQPEREPANSLPPTPPYFNTEKQENKTIKKKLNKKERWAENGTDLQHRPNDSLASPTKPESNTANANRALEAEIARKLSLLEKLNPRGR